MENKVMTNGEICASWRLAKDKLGQIGILADLCCTTKEDILQILLTEGVVDEAGNPPRLPGITEADAPDIIRMRKNGLPWEAVGKKYGVSAPTACKWLKRFEEKKSGGCKVSSKSAKKSEAVPAKDVSSNEDVADDSEGDDVSSATAVVLSFEETRRRRFMESLDIDKDFYNAVLEVYDLLRWVAKEYPGVRMVCEIDEDGVVMAAGEFQDLLAEYQGGGDPRGKSDAEQG